MRNRGKLQSPVDPDDTDSLRAMYCAHRVETEDELASDRDPRSRRVRRCLDQNPFDMLGY